MVAGDLVNYWRWVLDYHHRDVVPQYRHESRSGVATLTLHVFCIVNGVHFPTSPTIASWASFHGDQPLQQLHCDILVQRFSWIAGQMRRVVHSDVYHFGVVTAPPPLS